MSAPEAQLSQFKDALKLMKKKCTVLEGKLNESKAQQEASRLLLLSFLEYIRGPFSDTNQQPDLTFESLKKWWNSTDGKEISHSEETQSPDVSVVDEEKDKKIEELMEAIKQLEVEKNNLDLSLSRRQDDYMSLNETYIQLKATSEEKEKEFIELNNTCHRLQSENDYLHNHLTHCITSLTDFLHSDSEDSKPQSEEVSESLSSLLKEDVTYGSAVTQFITSMVLLKENARSSETGIKSNQELIEKQEGFLKQLQEELDTEKGENEKLQRRITMLEASSTQAEGVEEELEELEEANENLRTALRNAKENMEEQMKRQASLEAQLMSLQQEIVSIQETSNEMIQQAFSSSEVKEKDLKKRAEEAEKLAARREEELEELKNSWEHSVEQYEQELSVLRARKVAVEQKVTISEKCIDDHTKLYQTELQKRETELEEARQEIQELKCQVLERETELESTQQTGEEMNEQLQNQILSLTEQVRAMQTKLASQQTSLVDSKKKEMELENQMKIKLASSVKEIEEKDKEIIRQQQKNYEEELVRVREQISVLTHQLEEERKSNKKMRETVTQLNAIFESQDRQIEILRSDVTMRDSELLAGKEQIKKLSMLLSSKMSNAM